MAIEKTLTEAKEAAGSQANQFLTFSLADEEYGIDILKVQEIKGYVPTTRIPNSPSEVNGVLNLRGTVVPIVDLRKKFNLPDATYDQFTVIVVVVVQERIMGVIVDAVSEVMIIPEEDIQPAPTLSRSSQSALKGMGKVGEKLIILLDIDSILLGDHVSNMAAA